MWVNFRFSFGCKPLRRESDKHWLGWWQSARLQLVTLSYRVWFIHSGVPVHVCVCQCASGRERVWHTGCISLLKPQKSCLPQSNAVRVMISSAKTTARLKIGVKRINLYLWIHTTRMSTQKQVLNGLANTETGLTLISRNCTLGHFSHYRLV